MVAHIGTVAFIGIEARLMDIQVHVSSGLPSFTIVGLPDKAVAESRERVRAALGAIGLALPPKRITVNLAPADLPKEGSHFDLPIALGILVAMEALPSDALEGYLVLGELGLDGRVQAVPGVLLATLAASGEDLGLICPVATGGEAAWAQNIDILAPDNILSLLNHIKGQQQLNPPTPVMDEAVEYTPDYNSPNHFPSSQLLLNCALLCPVI
jgi:magnesium chelatase family protein